MLSLDANLLIVFLLVWILVLALTKFFFNPIKKIRGVRESRLQSDREAFRKASEELEASVTRVEMTLKAAKSEAEAVRFGLEAEAQKERNKILGEISSRARSQVAESRAELEEKVDKLKKELESQAEEWAERIEQRLLN